MDKKRILIIDDEQSFARLVQGYLEQTGKYDVYTEHQGTRAVLTARACRPDLILLDVIMPDMDGGMVAAQLKEDAQLRHVPIVFLTAIVSRGEVGGGAQASIIGGNAFIAKPESMEVIMACIDRILGQRLAAT